jgi:hypothetical protein
MVLDGEVLIAVTSGDVDAVKAWLAADPSRDVNDFCQEVSMDSGKPTMLHSVIAYVLGAGRTDGRARPRREPILQQLRFRRTIPILKKRAAAYRSIVFLCKLGDNGVVWKILEFWQATQ